jgi:hypothetical protein
MQKEYKVQKGESLQDVVLKLYGSLEYQSKFIDDNNLNEIDISYNQLYNVTDKIIITGLIENTNIEKKYILNQKPNPLDYNIYKYFELYDNQFGFIRAYYYYNYSFGYNYKEWEFITNIPGDDNYIIGLTKSIFPFYDFEYVGYIPPLTLINCEPYFEPFNVVYDDSIIKSVVPAITPAQMNTESNLKSLKVLNGQSFYDISLMAHGDLENSIKLAYDNNIDINTFDYSDKNSIIYYNTDIKNTLIHNFMNTLEVKPSTIYKEVVAPAPPSGHIAFNESFNVSFN